MIVFGIVFGLVFLLTFYKYKKNIAIICLTIFSIGIGISYIRFDFKQETYSGFVIDSHDNYFLLLSKGEKLYTYNKDNKYELGDYLSIAGSKSEISFTSIESEFDFEDYLKKKGVYYQLNPKKIGVSFSNPIRIREKRQKFLSHFSEEQQNLISALLFSDKSSDITIENASKLHIARLTSATGIFIYAYLHFLIFILTYFIKDKRAKIISLVSLIPYFIFTFPRFSVIRIFLLESLRIINEIFLKKKFRNIELISIAGISFLIFDYHLGYSIGFVLGFTLPIIITFIRDVNMRTKRLKNKILNMVFIYIFLIPFELKFYNGFNPLSLVVQTALTPMFVALATLSLFSFYGLPIYAVVDFFAKGLSNILGWLGKIAFQINAPPFNEWCILIYVLLFLIYCYYRSIDFVPIYKFVLSLFIISMTIYFVPITNLVTAQVSFINVGQGDSCLIRKGSSTVLIDTGGSIYKDIAKETLIPFFEKNRIYRLDLVITTHDDFDHSGAYDSLKENFYVKQRITDITSFPITINGMTFKNYNNHITEYSEENDKSLVIGFSLLGKDFLIMGDAPIKVEQNMMKEYGHIDCDILKAGHHGSQTSTCEDFVKYLSPKTAIISCGKNNKYGHPHDKVINILKKYNVEILRTDEIGTITYRGWVFG